MRTLDGLVNGDVAACPTFANEIAEAGAPDGDPPAVTR